MIRDRALAIPLALCVTLAAGAAARADCAASDFRDCAGQAWVDGDEMTTPLGAAWWPHPIWGEGDEAGSTNWYTEPEVVLRALAEVRQGRVRRLGHEYDTEMPLFGTRQFSLVIPGAPTGGPLGGNRLVYNDEYVASQVGQVGTQLDGLGHIGVAIGDPGDQSAMRFYNGFTAAESIASTGLVRLGIEKLHPVVARGVLLDVAAARGVESLEAGQVITMADVRAALERQGMKDFAFAEGDAILFRTGWERHWKTDNAKYNNGAPGIGMEVARWIAEDVRAGLTGADTWPVDAVTGEGVPTEVPADCIFCVHAYLQTRHGIVNHENLKLARLAQTGIYRFAYIFAPAPIRGATGSMGAPIALY